MKNIFKTAGLALAITFFLAACSGKRNGNAADTTQMDSSTTVKSTTDTAIRTDSMVARDTNTLNPSNQNVTKAPGNVDTMKKTVTNTTVVKKSVVKKH